MSPLKAPAPRGIRILDEDHPQGGRVEAWVLHYRGGYAVDVRPYSVPLVGVRRYDVDRCPVLPIGAATPFRATTLAAIAADPRTLLAARMLAGLDVDVDAGVTS